MDENAETVADSDMCAALWLDVATRFVSTDLCSGKRSPRYNLFADTLGGLIDCEISLEHAE